MQNIDHCAIIALLISARLGQLGMSKLKLLLVQSATGIPFIKKLYRLVLLSFIKIKLMLVPISYKLTVLFLDLYHQYKVTLCDMSTFNFNTNSLTNVQNCTSATSQLKHKCVRF